MRKLVPCSVCQRHVRSTEAACPFCGGALTESSPSDDFVPGLVSRAAALALTATLAATGCNRNEPARPPAPPTAQSDEYNPPPGPPLQVQNAVPRPNPLTAPAPAYGVPPRPQPPQTQKPDPTVPSPQVAVPLPQRPNPYGSMATRYGAPPRPTRPNNPFE